MLRTFTVAFCAAALAAPAVADATASIILDLGADGEIAGASYLCGADTLSVRYVNAGANALALIPIEGEVHVFVGVTAGSGARYVSGRYEWWTRGGSATLRNSMDEADIVTCTVATDVAPDD